MKSSGRWFRDASVLGLVLLGSGGPITAAHGDHENRYTFTPIAFLGDSAPGGATFSDDFEPVLSNRGDVAFDASLSDGDAAEGIFLSRRGHLSEVVRHGQAAPGGGVFSTVELGNIGINSRGDVAFAFSLEPFTFDDAPPLYHGGVYRLPAGRSELEAVMTPDVTTAPDGSVFVGTDFNVSLNESGELAFVGSVNTASGIARGVYVASAHGEIRRVAGQGDRTPSGATLAEAVAPMNNDDGDVAFGGSLSSDPSGAFQVFVKRAHRRELEQVTTAGATAPGGGLFTQSLGHHINDRGDIVLLGFVDTGADEPIAELFSYSSGTLTRVVGPGDPMPGGGHVALLGASVLVGPSEFALNNRGDVAFNATLDNGGEGLFVISHGAPSLVVQTGTVIPGLGTVLNLETFPEFQPIGFPTGSATVNDDGQVAFACTLTDGRTVLLLATRR